MRDQKSVYLIESGHIVGGTVPHWPVSFSRAGLAKFTLSGAPPGVSIISARLLARQTGTSTSHGTPSHRSVEITLTHNGQPVASDYSATVTVSGDLLRVPGNRPNENDTEKAQVADLSASVLMKRHPAVILSTDTLAVTEGSESYYTVRLGRPPAAAVTVSITGNTNAAGLRVTPGTLTFPAGANWAAPQRVTVAADHDNDAVNPPPVALTHTVTGGFSGESAALSVNIHDDEGPVILLEHPKLDVTEAQPKIYRVKLSRAPAPAADVTVRVSAIGERARWISIDNDDAGTFGDPFPNPLTFTPANWDEWQRVRFHTWPDHDVDDNTAILRHTASGVNYEGVTADLPLSISDLDEQGIIPSLATLAVREGFGASFTVKLDTHPKANTVTLTVTGHANTDLTVDTDPHKPGNQDTLTFTTDPATLATTHWQVLRSVRVFAGHDGDTVDDTATLRLTTAGGDYTGLTADITVNIADDDEAAMAGLVLSPAAVSVDEGGSAAWTVALETQPSAAVTVALAAAVVSGRPDLFASPPQFNLSPASLTFQPSQWNVAQTVTASIGEDDARATNWSASVAHTASGGGYDAVSATQAVTVRDNDAGVSGTLTIEPAAAAVVEGERAQFIVAADPAPTTDLAVAIKATWFGDVSGGSNAASGVIPAGRLASTILSLPTADNEVQAGNGSVTARIDAFGSHGYRAGSPAAATVTVRDDEGDSTVRRLRSHAGILGAGKSTIRGKKPDGAYTYSQTRWEVTEGQPRQDTYAYWQIVGPPHACVQLFVEVQGAFFYSPDQTHRSWGRSRVCLNEHGLKEPNVRIRNDLVDEPHGWAKMTVLAGDGYWVGPGDEGLHESWTIPIKDDDVSVASLDLSPPRIFENAELGANRSTVTASLSGPTANDVTLVVEADPVSPATADDFTLSQNRRLTIPAGQTASTGKVTVTAADDDSVEVYKEVTVWATASGGLDPVGQPEDVTLTIANDDKPRLRIAADAASVTEGTPAAFTVTSDVAVPADLTVNFEVAQSGGFVAAGNLGRGTVTLTTGAQTVSFTVSTVADGTDEANGTVTATLAAGDYGTVGTNNAATVAVVDDDPGHVTLTTPVRDAYEGLDIYAQIHLALNRGLVSGEVLAVPLLFQPIGGSSATPNEDFTLYAGGSAGVRLDRDTSTVVFTGLDSGAGPSAVTVQVIAEVDDDADSERFYVDIPAGSTGAAPRLTATGLGGGVTGSRGDRRHAMYLRDRGVNQRTLGWAAKALEVTETAAAGSIGVELSSPASEALTFEVCLSDGTATFGTDYRGVVLGTESCTGTNSVTNADLTIGAGASRATVSFTSIADAIDEPDETYTAWLKHDRWEDLATSPRVLEVTLRDDDPTVVRLARAGRSAIREGDKVAFTVSLERALAKGEVIDAPLSISGAGVTPGDWSLAAKSGAANTGATLLGTAAPAVRFAGAGARTATLELTATAQDGAEVGGETFTVALGSNAQFDADADTNVGGGADPHGVDNAFNVKVNDNETGTVTRTLGWAATAQSVAEGAAGAEKQFSVNAALSAGTGPATFRVCLADGAATLGATGDYRGFPGDARCTGTGNANPDPAIASGQSSQAVSLTLRGDGEDEPDETFSATLSLPDAVAGLGLNAPKSTHTVTIVDDDPTVVSLDGPGSGVTVSEGGSTQFTINLGRTLVAGETIDVPLAVSGTNVTPDEWTLAKNPAGRNTGVSLLATDSATPAVRFAGGGARTAYLELTPAIDARVEAGGETFTVALGPDGAGANGFDRTGLGTNVGGGADPHGTDNAFDLTVTDAQTPQIGLSTVALTVAEGGDASYTVRLATEPTQTVTVEVALPADSDLTLDPVPATLTFTTTDWNEPQTVTVTAGEDDDVLNDTDTLSHIAAGGDYELLTAALQVTVTDDDTTEVLLSKETLALTEGGDADTYTVTLASAPTSDVIVDITGLADTDLTLEPSSAQLVFTSANWNEPQTVTVTPGEDDDTVNDEATLTHTASGGDYDALTATLKVNTTDDDSPNLVLSEGTLEVGEGSSAGYTVRLATEPSATVTVAITGQAGAELTPSPASLTFTTSNWETEQTVSVSAGEDDDAADDTATLTHTASGGDYAGKSADLTVNTTDDDEAGIVLSAATLAVTEDSDAEYTVKLATEPTATVTVAITGQAGTELTPSPTSLTFTASNWATAQTVTVSAGEDDDTVNDTATLTHTASGGDYAGETADLTVNTTDDDSPNLVLSKNPLTVAEGGSASYTVKLATEPTANVTVAIAVPANTDVTRNPASLTFTTTDWASEQTVTVSAAGDDDAVDDTATLAHTASGGDYASVTADLAVTVTDDETAEILLSKETLTVTEGADADYTVKLTSQPTANVTVTIAGHANTDLTLDPSSATLTFTTSNWNTAQTVTVSADEDDDSDNDTARLTHTASGGDYATLTAALAVTVTDDDTPNLLLSDATLTVAEGSSAGYTVTLATQPSASVTVAITGHAGTVLTPTPESLTFTTSDWGTAQTVTVSVPEDGDRAAGKATLKHTASGGDYAGKTATVTATASDNDPTVVRLTRVGTGVVYEGGTIGFTVTLGRALVEDEIIDVPLSIGGGAGVSTADWSLAGKSGASNTGVTLTGATTDTPNLRFEDAGARVAELTLEATVDGVPETGGETFTIALGPDGAGANGFDRSGLGTNVGGGADPHATEKTFNVTVNDGRTIGWAATALTATETAAGGDANGTVALSSGAGPVTFRVCVEEGTAKFPADFLSFGSKSTNRCTGTSSNSDPSLSSTQSSRAVALPLAADTLDEPRETYTAALSLPTATPGLSLDAAKTTATVTVIDDDPTSVTLSAPGGNVSEKGGVKTVTVALGRALVSPEALTVTVAIGGGAASGTDYTIACKNQTGVQCGGLSGGKLPITFTGGANAKRATTLTLTGIGDNTDEGAETVSLALDPLTASSGTNLDGGASGSGTVDFRFNETPTAGFDRDNYFVLEGATFSLPVVLDQPAPERLEVGVRCLAGTAERNGDYVDGDCRAVVFEPGDDQQSVRIRIRVDGATEGDEQFTVELFSEHPDRVGVGRSPAAVTIWDRETPVAGVALGAASVTVGEGGASGRYSVVLRKQPTGGACRGCPSGDVTVTVTSADPAAAKVRVGSAQPGASATLTFTRSNWDRLQYVHVAAVDDADADDERTTLTHTVSGIEEYENVTAKSVGVRVRDDDRTDTPVVSISGGNAVTEGGTITFDLSASPAPAGAITVNVEVTQKGSFAKSGQAGSRTATIGTDGTGTLTVGTDDDSIDEPPGAITAALATGDGYLVHGSSHTATATVNDNDEAPPATPIVSIANGNNVDEGGAITFNLSASPAPASAITVNVKVADSGSFAGSGQTGDRTATVGTDGTGTLTVTTVPDDVDEPHGTITATLKAGGGYSVHATANSGTAAVNDDDDPPPATPVVSIADGNDVTEGGAITFNLSASPAPASAITVNVKVADSGSFAGSGQTGDRTATIGTNGTGTLTVTTVPDSVNEPDGTITATLRAGNGYSVHGTNNSATADVADDDKPVVSIADGNDVTEGGVITFNLSASPAPASALTVNIDVTDSGDFAEDGQDGDRTASIGTDGTGTLTVTTEQDTDDEDNGTITADLAAGGGYTVHGTANSGTADVLDDDLPPPTVSITKGADVTEGQDVTFTLTSTPATAGLAVRVRITQSGNFASPSSQIATRTFTTNSNGVANIAITTEDDGIDEPNGSISARILTGTGYRPAATTTVTVDVEDNDLPPPTVSVSRAAAKVTEGQDVTFTVTVNPAPAAALDVKIEIAQTGNYVAASALGVKTVTVPTSGSEDHTVATVNDNVDEPDGSLSATVKSGTGYVVAASPNDSASVAVEDDEVTDYDGIEVSIEDASAKEGQDLEFAITLNEPAPGPITVQTVCIPGSAKIGYDFECYGSEVSFEEGDTRKVYRVWAVEDDVDEGEETFEVDIRRPNPAAVTIVRATAKGAIENDGPLPEAWLGRFGRAVAEQALEGVAARIAAARGGARTPGFRGTIAGRPIGGNGFAGTGARCAAPADTAAASPAGRDEPESPPAGQAASPRGSGAEGARGTLGGPVAAGAACDGDAFGPGTDEGAFAGRDALREPGIGWPQAQGSQGFGGASAGPFGAGVGGGIGPDGSTSFGSGGAPGVGGGFDGGAGQMAMGAGGGWGGPPQGQYPGMQTSTLQYLLMGSSFTYTGREDGGGGTLGFWGRGAQSTFHGRKGPLNLDGEVASAMLGVDYARGAWLVGVALTRSLGEGGWSSPANGSGTAESTLTAAVPYAAWDASERLSLWGAAGYGAGRMTLRPGASRADRMAYPLSNRPFPEPGRNGPEAAHETLRAGLGWSMAALGLRGSLFGGEGRGPALAAVSDALWSRTTSEKTEGMMAGAADVTRLRLGLEGGWRFGLPGGGSLTPKIEAGLRHDGGDAETGFGVEVGGGLAVAAPRLGLSLDIQARTLLAHEADGRRDTGFSASLAYDPAPDSRRGLSLNLRQSIGGQATGGLDALFASDPLGNRMGQDMTKRWTLEAAYGMPAFRERFIGSPTLGYGASDFGRDMSLGWQLEPDGPDAPDLTFGLKLSRRESPLNPPEHGLGIEIRTRW